MRYVCIDLETTGLDPNTCQIIEFAAVIRDFQIPSDQYVSTPIKESPSFHCYVKHDIYQGDPYALALNARVLEQLGAPKADAQVYTTSELISKLFEWLTQNGFKPSTKTCRIHFVAAGKNFGNFDLQFLKRIPNWENHFNVSSRILDPAMLWIRPDDNRVPGLKTCMGRAGVDGEVTHHALQDVYDTIETLEKGLENLWGYSSDG